MSMNWSSVCWHDETVQCSSVATQFRCTEKFYSPAGNLMQFPPKKKIKIGQDFANLGILPKFDTTLLRHMLGTLQQQGLLTFCYCAVYLSIAKLGLQYSLFVFFFYFQLFWLPVLLNKNDEIKYWVQRTAFRSWLMLLTAHHYLNWSWPTVESIDVKKRAEKK